MRPIRLLSVSLIVLIAVIVLLGFSTPLPTVAQGARSRTPTATIDPKAFDIDSATHYKSPDGVLEISLPKGWITRPASSPLTSYLFALRGNSASSQDLMGLQVILGNPNLVYQYVFNLSEAFETPEAAFEAFKKAQPSLTFGDTQPATISTYSGVKMAITIPAAQGFVETQAEVWVAGLPNNQIVCLILSAQASVWDDGGKSILYKMVDSMSLKPEKVPTVTPTATTNPKLVTPTATLDSGAFDLSTARHYKSADGVVEISLPRSWQADTTPLDRVRLYNFFYDVGRPGGLGLGIYLGSTDDIYRLILRLDSSADSTDAALQTFKDAQSASSVTLGEIEPVTWSDFTGSKMTIGIAGTSNTPALSGEIWLLTLPDDKTIILVPESDRTTWESRARPLLLKMIESLKLNLDKLIAPTSSAPTSPPRLTPLPPRLTMTAFPLIPGQ